MPPIEDLMATRWSMKRDATTFSMIVRRHSGWVHATAKRILGNSADADEVTQECFEALVRCREMPESYLGAWLHRVAVNQSVKRLRGDARRRNRETRYATETQQQIPEPQWEDLAEHIDEAVTQLPEEVRGPVVAHFMEGRSHVDIAQAMGLPRTTVTSRIARGIESVREFLDKRGVAIASAALTTMLTTRWSEATRISPALNARLLRLSIEQTRRNLAGRGPLLPEGSVERKLVINKMIMAVFILGLAFLGPWVVVKMPKHRNPAPAPVVTQTVDKQNQPEQPAPIPTPEDANAVASPAVEPPPSPPVPGIPSAPPTGSIRGAVRYAGKPLSDLRIRVEYIGKTFAEFETRTDATGTYSLTGLPPGKPRLTFYPPWHDDNVDRLAVVEAGKVTVLDFNSEYNAAIEGRVTYRGQPIPDLPVNISLVAQDTSIHEFHTKSTAEGSFKFPHVPPGTAIVKVIEGGEDNWHATIRTEQTSPNETTTLDIELPTERGGILCQASAPEDYSPFLQGVLWGAFEMTAFDAETLHRMAAFKVAEPPCSADGLMHVTGLEPGTYTVFVVVSEAHGREERGEQAMMESARIATSVIQVAENLDTSIQLAVR